MRRKFVESRVTNLGTGTSPRRAAWSSVEDALTFLAPGPALSAVGGLGAGSGTQTDTALSSGLAGNSTFLLSLPVRGRRGLGGAPACPECKAASHARPCRPHRASTTAPLTGSRHLGSAPGPRPPAPPDLPAHRPLSPAPSGVQGPRAAPRPRAGSEAKLGRGPERPGRRARGRRRAPPLRSGPCQCFALGAGERLGVLPQGPGPGAPRLRPFRRVGSARRAFPSGRRRPRVRAAGWGPGQGEGSRGPLARHWLIFYSVDMFSYC